MSHILLNIKSKYILESIFSFVNYNRTLKLIKHNKQLQTNLELNIENYKKQTSYQYVTTKKIYKLEVEDNEYDFPIWKQIIFFSTHTAFSIIFFIYVLVFASLLASKGAFNKYNTKENYNNNYLNIIDKINFSLFGFLAYILISYFLTVCYISGCEQDYGGKQIIKKLILIVIALIYLFYEILLIIKLYLSYEIKKNNLTWFMECDYALIILIFLYLIFISAWIYLYFKYSGELVSGTRGIFLTKFRGINIYEYKLPNDFNDLNDYDKRKYILNNINEYDIIISKEQENLISLINNYRKENNVVELSYDDEIKFKDLIFENYSEPILNKNKNIFTYSNGNYLLKFPLDEFKILFNNKEKSIINILLNDYLNKIIIIDKNNISYIFIFYSNNKNIEFTNKTTKSDKIIKFRKFYDSLYSHEDFKFYDSD